MPVVYFPLFGFGLLAAGYLPQLWPLSGAFLLVLPLLWLTHRWSPPVCRACLCAVLGFLVGITLNHRLVVSQLPADREGEDFLVQGRIVGLPDADSRRTRFTLDVESFKPLEGPPVERVPRRLQVSWYANEALSSGDRWRLRVRLSAPRGFVNPGGFDYQAWLLRQGIGAVGYVRDDDRNRRLGADGRGVGAWRQTLRSWLLQTADGDQAGLLLALLIGDRSGISSEQWQQLQKTGTNHLIAISGLHVGFVALLGFALGSLLGRVGQLAVTRVPASVIGHIFAMSCALGYSALAGFSLPTQRALIMVLVAQWALLCRRNPRVWQGVGLAFLAVLLLDPLAGFDLGFWLSFGAVGVLLLVLSDRFNTKATGLVAFFRAQWGIFIGLLVPLALFLNTSTLLAPVANTLAIPLVTFLVVPALLIAAVLQGVWPLLSAVVLALASLGLRVLMGWLEMLLSLGGDFATPVVTFSFFGLLLAALAVGVLLLPPVPGRWLGYPALLFAVGLAIGLPPRPQPPLLVAALDVGQGLAMVVRTPNHSLVYDAGPVYSDRLDAGSAIITPFLRRLGVAELDALVVSHEHADHAGGALGLVRQVSTKRVLAGQPESLAELQASSCHTAPAWEWDEVSFRFLTWTGLDEAPSNNRSCVLLVEYGDERLLLTGDIEREVEWRLVGQSQLPASVRVLQVPHHGSKSSSTPVFVEQVKARYGVISAGYRGRHRHPHERVEQRYRAQGTQLLNTGQSGAVLFYWRSADQGPELRLAREQWRRHWYR